METSLTQLVDGVWFESEPVSIVGMPLTVTMSVLRLPNGGLLLYSPIAYTAERRVALEALGPIEHVYAPSHFHHRRVCDWAQAVPQCRVHAPAMLAKRYPELRIDRQLGSERESAFAGVIDEITIDGCRLGETVLVHRPSRTLVVADLVHNVGAPSHTWTKLYTKAMGFYDRVALSRMLQWTAFSDKQAARRSVERVLQLDFERIIVGHGTPVIQDAKPAFAEAFRWLGASYCD